MNCGYAAPQGAVAPLVSQGYAQDGALVDPKVIGGIGVIEAAQLVSGAEQGGMIAAAHIAAASTAKRRLPVYTNLDAVPDDLKPRVAGMFNNPLGHYQDRYLLTLADAFVVGQGSVVVTDGVRHNLLRDSAGEFLAHERVPDGMSRGEGGVFTVNEPIHRHFHSDCLLLKRPWSNNYGHWLVDQAMALSYLCHTGTLRTNHIVVSKVDSPRLQEIMRETINAILPGAIVHEHPNAEVWHFRSLDYVMPLHIPPLTKLPAAMEFLRQDILAMPVPDTPWPKRFYIVRKGGPRNLVNELEIMALAASHGFGLVIPERMSIAEQAAMFNQAEAILGVKGAAMANILFAGQGTRLMIMSPAGFIDPFFYDIASVRGVAYSEVFSEAQTERPEGNLNDFRVDPRAVEKMIIASLMPAEILA